MFTCAITSYIIYHFWHFFACCYSCRGDALAERLQEQSVEPSSKKEDGTFILESFL